VVVSPNAGFAAAAILALMSALLLVGMRFGQGIEEKGQA